MRKIFNFIVGFVVGLMFTIPIFAEPIKKEFSQYFIVETQQSPLKVQKNVNSIVSTDVERLAYEREYKTSGRTNLTKQDIPQRLVIIQRQHLEINPFRLELKGKENKSRRMTFSEYLALGTHFLNPRNSKY